MNLRSAANLIRNEYRERQTAADEAYRRAMEAHPELYAAEKAVRAAVLDGADNVAELERRRDKLAAECGVKRAAPRCAKCGDTGVVGNEYCDCVRRRAARETVGFSAPPFAFGDGDTDVFEGEDKAIADAAYRGMRIFCEKFPDTKNVNVLLMGRAGTGKTYLAACIANELERRGFGTLFLTAFRFNDICLKYHTSFDAGRADGLNALLGADLLVIDDLGSESILKNVTLEYLFTVISERMNAGRHTVITTNLTSAQLENRYGERTASRLFSGRVCLTVALNGKDLRR